MHMFFLHEFLICMLLMLNYGCWFWFVVSQEGQKPSSIISAHLNVGSPIQPDASNGNTQVFVNGREITKVELRMLQVENLFNICTDSFERPSIKNYISFFC